MNTPLPKGITITADQRFRLRVSVRKGSTQTIERTFDDLPSARQAKADAQRIRDAGGDVAAQWRRRAEVERKSQQCTVRQAADEFRNAKGRVVRSTTQRTYDGQITSMILPHLGDLFIGDLDEDTVFAWIEILAGVAPDRHGVVHRGYSIESQKTALNKLRVIVGRQRAVLRPYGFPWGNVAAIPPHNPKKTANEPMRWGGTNGDKPPAPTYTKVAEIAAGVPAACRIVIWFLAILGLRRGETMGITNSEFSEDCEGRLWVSIWRQADLRNGESLEWVKTETSCRKLPLPQVLADYVYRYWDRYHDGYRPHLGARHPRHSTRLAVTSTGRAADGSYMEATPNYLPNHLAKACERAEYAFRDVGYRLRPHDFRRTCITYLLMRHQVLAAIETDQTAPGDDVELSRRIYDLLTRPSGPTDADVSRFVGHDIKAGGSPDTMASEVTVKHYRRRLFGSDHTDVERAFCEIAAILDRIVRHEIGELRDDPGPEDGYAVIDPDDPDWMLLPAASAACGLGEEALLYGIRKGRYEGSLCWFADGDRKPPGPRWAIRTDCVNTISNRYDRTLMMPKSVAAEHLGVSCNFVDRLIADGDLTVTDRTGCGVYVATADVETLRLRILTIVARCFDGNGPKSARQAFARFRNEQQPYEFEQARTMYQAGVGFADIAQVTGHPPATLRTRARRDRWIGGTDEADTPPELRNEIKAVFKRPTFARTTMWDRWVAAAVDAKLLRKAGATTYRPTAHTSSGDTGNGTETV